MRWHQINLVGIGPKVAEDIGRALGVIRDDPSDDLSVTGHGNLSACFDFGKQG